MSTIISSVLRLHYYIDLKRDQNEIKLEVLKVDDTFEAYEDAFIISRLVDAYLLSITMPLLFIVSSPKRRQAIRKYFSKRYGITILKMTNFVILSSADMNFRRNNRLRPLTSMISRNNSSNQIHPSSNQNIAAIA